MIFIPDANISGPEVTRELGVVLINEGTFVVPEANTRSQRTRSFQHYISFFVKVSDLFLILIEYLDIDSHYRESLVAPFKT